MPHASALIQKENSKLVVLVITSILGAIAMIPYCWVPDRDASHCLSTYGGLFLIALGAEICGSVVGFLFGIPRTLASGDRASPPAGSERDAGESHYVSSTTYSDNTNLEQVSDWLTKILVGLGLAHLGTIKSELANLATYLGPAVSLPSTSSPIVTVVVVFYATTGFLLTYIWTRVYFKRVLRESDDTRLLAHKVEHLEASAERTDLLGPAISLGLSALSLEPRLDPYLPEDRPELLRMTDDPVAGRHLAEMQQYRNDAIARLENIIETAQLDRRANIVLARLYRKNKNIETAVELLQRAITAREKADLADADTGALYYNIACYHSLFAENSQLSADKTETSQHQHAIAEGVRCIKRALQLCPEDLARAKIDRDLDYIRSRIPELESPESELSHPQPEKQ
ncbi:MAG: hypothetical protein SGI86_00850 [Deltaproteobacteria bacterium]|nr:hypothetical protein [Deltaproteobacteria bacterium]